MLRRRGVAVADCRAWDLPPVERPVVRDDPDLLERALPDPPLLAPVLLAPVLLEPPRLALERAAEPVDRPLLLAPDRVPDALDPDADVRVPVLAFEAIPTD